jgi:cell division initiation protein
MNVSPLDLRQQRFRRAFRGFDTIEVSSFLMAAADDYEQALRETDRLRHELARLEGVIAQHREHEKSLTATMVVAQKLAEDFKSNAEEEAKRTLRDAQSRSDVLLEKAQNRLAEIQRDIEGLKLRRRDVETSIQATIQTLRNTLEVVQSQDSRDRDDKVLLHRPRLAEPPADAIENVTAFTESRQEAQAV